MFTIFYKGFYIHGHCDKPVVSVTYPGDAMPQQFKSLHAAKCRITQYLKEQ